jgi:hypothetical protein
MSVTKEEMLKRLNHLKAECERSSEDGCKDRCDFSEILNCTEETKAIRNLIENGPEVDANWIIKKVDEYWVDDDRASVYAVVLKILRVTDVRVRERHDTA